MSAYPYNGVDVSWPQGAGWKPSGVDFAVVAAASNDSGRAFVQSTYHAQVNTARAHGLEVAHYFFNGPEDPAAFAAYCAAILYDFRDGDTLWLDVERQSNGGPAYTPAQALAFAVEMKAHTGVLPGVYVNHAELVGENWEPNAAAGQLLWLAYYSSTMPALKWWSEAAMWQHADTPDDLDVAKYTHAQMRTMQNGGPTTTPSIETDDSEMLSTEAQTFLAQLVADAVSKLADDIRRDARGRLYVNPDTHEYAIIAWHLPSDDDAKVIRTFDPARVAAYYGYELIGDAVAQAEPRPDTQWESLFTLADGTDVAYQSAIADRAARIAAAAHTATDTTATQGA